MDRRLRRSHLLTPVSDDLVLPGPLLDSLKVSGLRVDESAVRRQEVKAGWVGRDLRLVAEVPVVDYVNGEDGDLDGLTGPVEVHIKYVPHGYANTSTPVS